MSNEKGNDKPLKAIKADSSKLEKTLRLSSDELLAQAISDLLKRDEMDEPEKE